jgi:hypothetical protein
MQNLLLTGSSGFVGQNFLKMFKLTSEYQIHIFDRNNENQAQNKKYLCFYFPEFILKFMLKLLGKSSIVDRLMRNFIVSNTLKTSDAYSQTQAFTISFGHSI